MNQDARRTLLAVFAGGAAVLGVLTINGSWLTPGAHSDAVAYLSAAESFSERRTFEVPTTSWSDPDSVSVLSHFPPGFSLLLSVPLSFGTQAHAAALWTMALSAGVAMIFLTLLVSEVFGVGAAGLYAALLLLTPPFVRLHLAIWSEPTYLAITAVLLYAMVKRPTRAWAHGLLAGAGLMVRYVGVAGTLAAVVWAVAQAGTRRQRLKAVAWAGGPSAIFLLWWSRYVAQGAESIREPGVYGGFGPAISEVASMLSDWLVPGRATLDVGLAFAMALGGVGVIGWAGRNGAWNAPERRVLLRATALFAVSYIAVVVVSRFLADPLIPFDARVFMPVLVLVTAGFAASATELARGAGAKGWTVLALGVTIWGVAALREDRVGVASVNEGGIYFTNRGWMIDPVVRWVDNVSTAYPTLYSNEPALLFYQSSRHAKELPNAGEDFEAFARAFRKRPGALVFAYPLHRVNLGEEIFAEALGLTRVVRTGMGAVYVP